jgi:hypothetical protein
MNPIHSYFQLTSTKHSARTPDSTRKSVSAVGLSKMHSDLDYDPSAKPQRQTASSMNEGTDSQSITSSSSGGISINQREASVSDLCAEMPDSLTFDDYFDFKMDTQNSTTSSSHHGRSISELSGISDESSVAGKRQLGTGVILLAQRLINGELKQEKEKPELIG